MQFNIVIRSTENVAVSYGHELICMRLLECKVRVPVMFVRNRR